MKVEAASREGSCSLSAGREAGVSVEARGRGPSHPIETHKIAPAASAGPARWLPLQRSWSRTRASSTVTAGESVIVAISVSAP
jgi:hypothetical protein